MESQIQISKEIQSLKKSKSNEKQSETENQNQNHQQIEMAQQLQGNQICLKNQKTNSNQSPTKIQNSMEKQPKLSFSKNEIQDHQNFSKFDHLQIKETFQTNEEDQRVIIEKLLDHILKMESQIKQNKIDQEKQDREIILLKQQLQDYKLQERQKTKKNKGKEFEFCKIHQNKKCIYLSLDKQFKYCEICVNEKSQLEKEAENLLQKLEIAEEKIQAIINQTNQELDQMKEFSDKVKFYQQYFIQKLEEQFFDIDEFRANIENAKNYSDTELLKK